MSRMCLYKYSYRDIIWLGSSYYTASVSRLPLSVGGTTVSPLSSRRCTQPERDIRRTTHYEKPR